MPLSEWVLSVTAWVSLWCWAGAEWLQHRAAAESRDRHGRWAFTAGAAALLAHVGTAFQVRHDWSHAAAMRQVAEQTERVTGLAFGGGLFVNYLFVALWMIEVSWWWLAPAAYRTRAATFGWLVRGIFLFMFVNGAIVFVRGPQRWLGVTAILAVLAAWYRGRGREARHV